MDDSLRTLVSPLARFQRNPAPVFAGAFQPNLFGHATTSSALGSLFARDAPIECVNAFEESKMTGVVIRGGGAAAYCGAYLLRRAGVGVAAQLTDRARI